MTFEEGLKLGELLKWPVTTFVLVLVILLILRTTVQSLLERMRRAAFGNKALDFGEPAAIASEQQQLQAQVTLPIADASAAELPPPPPPPALAAMEAPIAAAISASSASDDIKRAWLIRGVAVAKLERAHEITYRLIVGSQIELLHRANAGIPLDIDGARAIYEAATFAFPEVYKNFTFDAWLAWPRNSGLTQIEIDPSNRSFIKITDNGRDFLHYLVGAGLTSPKMG